MKNTDTHSSNPINRIVPASLILTVAIFCTNAMAESGIQQEDNVLASFERDLNREPGAIAPAAARSPSEDPLHTQINVVLWNQGSDRSGDGQVLASFERDLNREPGAVTPPVIPAAEEDPLYVHVNRALWHNGLYDLSNDRLLAQVKR